MTYLLMLYLVAGAGARTTATPMETVEFGSLGDCNDALVKARSEPRPHNVAVYGFCLEVK